MNENMDKYIKEALTSMYEPDKKLNQSILCSARWKGKNNMTRIKKLPFAATIAICVFCIGTGTVYAAVHLLKETTPFEYGITTTKDINETQNTMFDVEKVGDIKDSKVESVSKETGNKETIWLSKEVQQVTEYMKISDDSVNWTDSSYIVDKTIYTFADYVTAAKEADMDNWLIKDYELMRNVDYVESKSEDIMHVREISATFKCGEGYFELVESKDLKLAEDDSIESILITNEVTDSEKYMSAQGHEFTIVDDVLDGTKRSCVSINYKNYSGTLSFYNMLDTEIYQVLDDIQIK